MQESAGTAAEDSEKGAGHVYHNITDCQELSNSSCLLFLFTSMSATTIRAAQNCSLLCNMVVQALQGERAVKRAAFLITHISKKESGVPSIASAEGLFQNFQGRLLRAASLQAFSQHK